MKKTNLPAILSALALLASCGGGNDNPTTAQPDGRVHALKVTTSLLVALPQGPDPLLDGLAGIPADAATRGMWSAVQAWPMNAIHAALLPNGKVLSYGAPADTDAQDGRTFDVWTPSLGFVTAGHVTSFDANRVNSFCSTATYLNDGRLLISGGNSSRGSQLYTAATQTSVNDASPMADDRWYSTMLSLPDGRAVVLGGMDPYQEAMANDPATAIQNGTVSMTPEIYTAGTGWRSLTGATSRDAFGPDYLRTSYPRAWVAPNGKVFGISTENMWVLDVDGNGGTGALTLAGKFKTPYNATNPVNVGPVSSAVMFAPGRILQVGGNGGFNGDGLPASNMATVIDINGVNPVLTETAVMGYARRYPNTVVLPNGQVLVTGGTRFGNNGDPDAVYPAEIWNPATGAWTVGASAARIRVYHSSTMLMPNGTVLSLGGGTPGPVYNQNVEVYYPPYLFKTAGTASQLATRPVLSGISALGFSHGAAAKVEMAVATAISRVVLIGAATTTHSFNTGQRFIDITGFTQTDDQLSFNMPASVNVAPPGYYQLVVLDAAGVPSKAVIVSLGQNQKPPPTPASVLTRGQTYAFAAQSAPGNVVGTTDDANALGVLLPAPAGSATPPNGQFVVRDGLADAACVSLESVSRPGQWLRHYNFRTMLGTSDGSDLFKADATFCPELGLSGTGLTLRSKNYPDHVVHHRNDEVWIDMQTTDTAFAQDATFAASPIAAIALPVVPAQDAAPLPSGATASYAPGLDAAGLSFSWNFGDGSAATAYSATSAATHGYANPGLYGVTLTVRSSDGRTTTKLFTQAVYGALTANAPRATTALLLEPRNGVSTRLWVVNPDNDSVSVFDTATSAKVAEIAVGAAPRSLARGADGRFWVANRDSASISIVDPAKLAVATTVPMPRASQPWGVLIAPDGNAYVSLEAKGQVQKLNGSTGATLATLAVGNNPRHLSVSGDSARLLVSRFITPPLPGEATAVIDTSTAGAEVVVVNTATMAVQTTVVLRHSDKTDTEIQGSGIPNDLGPAVISPDGKSAWVPSKQDNIKRGTLRNGVGLNFQNTVRAISSRIDMTTLAETLASRADHDNASVASASGFDATGSYLFVALETSRQVEVLNALTGAPLFRIEVGLAPQSVVVSADNTRLFVHNFMGRSVSVIDITPLTKNGEFRSTAVATLASVATDKLSATVLLGKQLFYDARDPRLARDSYMSCASCHNDAGHDGRVWDFTNLGEGLRNTIPLKGRASMGHGLMHWSGNFDEAQDFEGQIRNFSGGTGLMSNADFNTGTRSQPLGDKKAGISADLDALAAYLASLHTSSPSPYRNADGTLTAAAVAGKAVFATQGCASCHGGPAFTGSADAAPRKDIGTIKASSGQRLGAALGGIDIPTLRDVWATAPYLHDGSAPTLTAAVQAHNNVSMNATDLANLVEYLRQIGSDEPAPGAADTPTNLALGKPATQSSTNFSGDPGRAVDGNTSGDYNSNSITHTDNAAPQPWWQVDLGSQATIDSIRLWNRTDCCSDRLSNFFVFVSSTDMTGRTLAQLSTDPAVQQWQMVSLPGASLTLPASSRGRFVRVQLAGQNYLSLAEVQVFGTPQAAAANLSQGKPATQSSTAFGGDPARAVDGKTSGDWSQNSVTHTDNIAAQPWWQVDLGATASIDSVKLWNRTDCCADRLSNFYVFVANSDMTARTVAQLTADPSVTRVFVKSLNAATSLALPLGGASGRYVRIQLSGQDYLSLAEVQVFGAINLAQGRVATQSSTVQGGVASRAVDGNTSGSWALNSVTQTDATTQPWWQVDLGAAAKLGAVRLWNRTDCCGDQLSNFTVLVSAADMSAKTLAQLNADPGVIKIPAASLNGAPVMTLALNAASGRYVRVQLNGQNNLSLAEVQVFGTGP